MIKSPHFIFDRTLDSEELNFWSTFFDHFPCHHNRYCQSLIHHFSKEEKIDHKINIVSYYELFKDCESNEEMFELINESDWNHPTKSNFPNIIKDLNKIIPSAKPIELFLMSIYGGNVQDWSLKLTPNGINLNVLEGNYIDKITYVPQLAMITDLMAGRINEIFSSVNFKPIKITGKKEIFEISSGNYDRNQSFLISIKENNESTYLNNNNNSTLVIRRKMCEDFSSYIDLAFDCSANAVESKNISSPLGNEQSKLIKLIQLTSLSKSLNMKEISYNRKSKI